MRFRGLLAGLLCVGSGQVLFGQSSSSAPPELVVLHATVTDKHRNPVTTLGRENFKIFEDNVEQEIKEFKREDVPVSAGILVDSSGSMQTKRRRQIAAALAFVKASNPRSEFFVVNFEVHQYLDSDFTSNPEILRNALEKSDPRGGTAFYDALIAALDHLKKRASNAKKVLLVMGDGEDNESHSTLEQAVGRSRASEGAIYVIGLLNEQRKGDVKRAKHLLETISEVSGGAAFFPDGADDVEAMAAEIAEDIRNQYAISYVPRNAAPSARLRTLRVTAEARGQDKLTVRTRTGYYLTRK
jgi:VWFA-related protein